MKPEKKRTWAYVAMKYGKWWAGLSKHPGTRIGLFIWWFFTGETFNRVHEKLDKKSNEWATEQFNEGMVMGDFEPFCKCNAKENK